MIDDPRTIEPTVAADPGSARFLAYLAAIAANGFKRRTLYPGLSRTAWPDPRRFAVTGELERHADDIRRELLALDPLAFHQESERIERTGHWDIVFLYERGLKRPTICARCPVTTRIAESSETVRSLAGSAYFSRLSPGSVIAPHRGPTNVRIRCHLALVVPEGDLGLRVGGETRRWRAGRCLTFDDSLEHEVWNSAGSERIVLVIDLWHPDLTPHEIELLRGLHQYAFSAARSLGKFWQMNAQATNGRRVYYR